LLLARCGKFIGGGLTCWEDRGRGKLRSSLARLLFHGKGRKRRERESMTEEEKKKSGILKAIKEFVYGVAAHDSARFALKTRASMEHLFILITMGDMLGVPILPPYYSLRLLPYVVPQISTWKRRMLREKDFTDALA
jgi:hypothetical protein